MSPPVAPGANMAMVLPREKRKETRTRYVCGWCSNARKARVI